MPTLAAGSSTTISLAAGQELYFPAAGAGSAVIASGQLAGQVYQIGNSRQQIGPFSQAVQVSISALAALSYFVLADNPVLDPPLQDVVQDLSSGAQYAGGSPVSGAGDVTVNSRDAQGRVQSYTQGGIAYAVTYGPFGIATISGGGQVTTFNYDAVGNPTGTTTV